MKRLLDIYICADRLIQSIREGEYGDWYSVRRMNIGRY